MDKETGPERLRNLPQIRLLESQTQTCFQGLCSLSIDPFQAPSPFLAFPNNHQQTLQGASHPLLGQVLSAAFSNTPEQHHTPPDSRVKGTPYMSHGFGSWPPSAILGFFTLGRLAQERNDHIMNKSEKQNRRMLTEQFQVSTTKRHSKE